MKVLLVGLGSIGARHATILREMGHEVVAFRSEPRARNDLGIPQVYSWAEAAASKADVAFITNPTDLHVQTAIACANLGLHLFIEKPLSNALDGIDELDSICESRGLTCYVAYCLRFHPVIKALKRDLAGAKVDHVRVVCSSYLPSWRTDTDWKRSYSRSAARGGGVILDLSHEFDYIEFLFGRILSTRHQTGRVSEVTIDAEDCADVLLKTVRGIPVNLHLDFISRVEERRVLVDCDDRSIDADLLSGKVRTTTGDQTKEETYSVNRNDYLREQATYFFASLGKKENMNGLKEARRLLERLLEIRNG